MTQFITIIRQAVERLWVRAAAGACCCSLSRYFVVLCWNILLSVVGRRIKVLVMASLSCKGLKKINRWFCRFIWGKSVVCAFWMHKVFFSLPPTVASKGCVRLLSACILLNELGTGALWFCSACSCYCLPLFLHLAEFVQVQSNSQVMSGMKCASILFSVKHYKEEVSQSVQSCSLTKYKSCVLSSMLFRVWKRSFWRSGVWRTSVKDTFVSWTTQGLILICFVSEKDSSFEGRLSNKYNGPCWNPLLQLYCRNFWFLLSTSPW